MTWSVHHRSGPVGELHGLGVGEATRSAFVLEVDGPSVALGSTQREGVLDADVVAANGLAVTRRHSGGGLVVMMPGDVLWIDVVIAAGDPLWRTDVGEAFVWLGRVWAEALADLGHDAQLHRGGPRYAELGRAICFAGLGSGEVTVEGRKVVGMSQRRTRGWARFQCLVHRRFDPVLSRSLLSPDLCASLGEPLHERLCDGVGTVSDLEALSVRFLQRLALR